MTQARVLELTDIIQPDKLAVQVLDTFLEWNMLREQAKIKWEEIRRYVFATDTRSTSNSKLPWKNSTTLPKLCQIRDNLYSNYVATLFPQRKWNTWEANERDSNSVRKRDAILNYMYWCTSQPAFKHEMDKIIMDYIDYGNCFATVEWVDERIEYPGKIQVGFVGPMVRRISPNDIVMNPTAANFEHTPKLIRSLITIGELKNLLEQMSNDENRAEYETLFNYMKGIREKAAEFEGDWAERDRLYQVDGYTSFRDYLTSGLVEVITFYGDIYDQNTDTFLKNQVITVCDRHRLIGKKANPSYFGYAPIFHAPWRKRQDNLWGMGPLDNLVGMQYRIDHVENMKADIYDLVTFPVQKVKGFVEDYTWQPGEKIFVSEEGDVDMVVPDVNALNANFEIDKLESRMEEMAGAPREAMGFRTPGEKTKYEVQRLENASSRLYQNKITQFEEQVVEKILNAMLEMAQRLLTTSITIKVFDDELKVAAFQTLTPEDITGIGRIKPVAARHFAEQAELIQNLTNLSGSGLWQSVSPHFSTVKLAKILEKTFNLEDYEVVFPFIALTEQADAQKMINTLHEQVVQHAGTATGMGNDYDVASPPIQPPPPDQGS